MAALASVAATGGRCPSEYLWAFDCTFGSGYTAGSARAGIPSLGFRIGALPDLL
jgi:hypothetical protein